MRRLIVGALISLSIVGAAYAQGFGHLGDRFGRLGAGKKGGGGATCSNSLNYTQSCNLRFLFVQPL